MNLEYMESKVLEEEPKDEPKKEKFKPVDLGYGLTLIDEDPSNEYRG